MSNFITPPPYFNLNVENNHPLIPRGDNYWLTRKCLTVHSQDRDFSKWPFVHEFEINLPQDYLNIQSTRLIEITFPLNFYNFSRLNQNSFFAITINSGGDILDPPITDPVIICFSIEDGYYSKDQLATTLTYKLN